MCSMAHSKHYPPEFRQQIVDLYNAGTPVSQLVREYGLVEQTIYKWINRYSPKLEQDDGSKMSEADVHALQKRIAQLEMENEILKKATAIFAKER